MNNLNISLDELLKLKELGSGTEGRVFAYSKDIVLKIYRDSIVRLKDIRKQLNDEIKIYDKNNLQIANSDESIHFYHNEKNSNNDENIIRMRLTDTFKDMEIKQKSIKRTELPKGLLIVDGKISGCFMQRLYGIPIHKLTGMPQKYKFKILKNVFLDVEELLNNHIYHTDLSNSPFVNSKYFSDGKLHNQKGHSHILVNPFNLKTSILDLDGKRVPYMEQYNYEYEKEVLECLCTLLEEFYYKIDPEETKEQDEKEFEIRKMETNKDLANKIAYNGFENFNEMKKTLKL